MEVAARGVRTAEIVDAGQVAITAEDGAQFSMPESDCVFLPIAHSSAEELATYVCERLRAELGVLRTRAVSSVEVTVAESPLQEACYRIEL